MKEEGRSTKLKVQWAKFLNALALPVIVTYIDKYVSDKDLESRSSTIINREREGRVKERRREIALLTAWGLMGSS